MFPQYFKLPAAGHRDLARRLVSFIVGAHGVFILASILIGELAIYRRSHVNEFVIDVPLLIGLSLLYLSTLLRRRKQTAWLVTVLAYAFYLGITLTSASLRQIPLDDLTGTIALPLIVLGLLFAFRGEFSVRSDVRGFRGALVFSMGVLLVALAYGAVGFSLLDRSDFHQEIGLTSAVHYTIDQFDLTTARPLHPYTRRAHVFADSLSIVSIGAVGYAAISLFQPLRLRLADQSTNRRRLEGLLRKHGGYSEDFFKLWPHDKQYYFDDKGESALAFHVYRGVALCLGDPTGVRRRFSKLLDNFLTQCFNNDWLPALIHIERRHHRLYTSRGFTMQKLGQEAVVNIEHFHTSVARQKYFRHIVNKFTKQDYTCELLRPPHHSALLQRLQSISDDWLAAGGHVERGFVMGYYSPEYVQQCTLMVARDAAGTIQAFLSQVPAPFDRHEATFDMLRHASGSPGNINDYLLVQYLHSLQAEGYERLNLGLCPLVGLSEKRSDKANPIDSFLRFAYANGDRFYSFSGLYRFKNKYEPEWRDRYVAYQGGIRGFSRTMTALMRTMRSGVKK